MANKPLPLSHSKMSVYKECPMKYKLKYIDRLPEKPKHYFAFGNSIHKALEHMYTVTPMSLASLLEAFTRDWSASSFLAKGYKTEEEYKAAEKQGLTMLEAYYYKYYGFSKESIVSAEYRTTLAIGPVSITAIVDRIDSAGAPGLVKILDYKTGKNVSREPDQLYLYQKVLESSPDFRQLVSRLSGGHPDDVKVGAMGFLHVPSLGETWLQRATDEQMKAFWDGVLGIAERIRGGMFEATPAYKKCMFCDFVAACPARMAPSAPWKGTGYEPEIPLAIKSGPQEQAALFKTLRALAGAGLAAAKAAKDITRSIK